MPRRRKKKRVEHDLDAEEHIYIAKDRHGRKRRYRLRTSEGVIEWRMPGGRKFYALMLEEVE